VSPIAARANIWNFIAKTFAIALLLASSMILVTGLVGSDRGLSETRASAPLAIQPAR